jgi:chromosome segregation ATPase
LGEISAAAGLERPKISEKEKVDPDSVKDLYRARVIKHLSEKNVNIEEVQTVIGQIRKIFARPPKRSFINIFQSSPEHPFIKSLDENIKNNLQPNALQGFSPKVVAEGMDERAKKITQMQTLIQGDINQRALAIKEYKEFLEQAKHELAAVENLRGQARILSSPVENHNSELNRLKKEMEELKEKSDTILKDKNSMSQDRQKEVNDSLTALTAAIAKVEALIENNQKTVKNINDKLKHEFITKGEAEKILEEGKEKLEASILEAEKQYQLAQCESFVIRACKLEVSLLQKKSSIESTAEGADKLIEEVREDQRENMKEKRKAILSLIEKIDTTNSANFKAIENFRSTINDPKAGGPTKEDACLKCETLLSTPINQHNNEENPREEQVLLQKIKSEHAQIKLANAQKEFFNMMKTNLSNQIPYWRKQRIIGGKEVNYEGKKIKVPTGIGQMINLLGPSPNYSPHLFKEPKDNKKEFTPKEINEYLKKIQEIASDRQQYRSLNRKTATKEIYKLAESIPSLDMPPATPEEMANQAKQFEQLTQEMQKIQAKYFPSSVPAVDSENKIKPR